MRIFWFLDEAESRNQRWGPRPPLFSKQVWLRVDKWVVELSTPWVDLTLATYRVPFRRFNAILSFEDLQGDLRMMIVGIYFHQAFKLQMSLPDVFRFKHGPDIYIRLSEFPNQLQGVSVAV